MATFVVMSDMSDPSGVETEFVRDHFSVIAFIAPVIWLAWCRLWIEAVAALAAVACLAGLGTVTGFGNTASVLSVLVSIFVAAEGPQLRILALERRGFRQVAAVEADNAENAAIRYFAQSRVPGREQGPNRPTAIRYPAAGQTVVGPVLGLFDYPGGR